MEEKEKGTWKELFEILGEMAKDWLDFVFKVSVMLACFKYLQVI